MKQNNSTGQNQFKILNNFLALPIGIAKPEVCERKLSGTRRTNLFICFLHNLLSTVFVLCISVSLSGIYKTKICFYKFPLAFIGTSCLVSTTLLLFQLYFFSNNQYLSKKEKKKKNNKKEQDKIDLGSSSLINKLLP